MSAESGIGTFRGSSGLWSGILGKLVLGYFGTPVGWKFTPGFTWKQYVQRFYTEIANASPNEGHKALAELERSCFPNLSIITQNVDGLHQRAGSSRVFEVHGTVTRHRCIKNGHIYDFGPQEDSDGKLQELPTSSPKCLTCGSLLRPDCVLFTEGLPSDAWDDSVIACSKLKQGDVMLIIGTSATVYPAAGLPKYASDKGATLIDINLAPTSFQDLNGYKFLKGGAATILPELVEKVKQLREERVSSKL